MMGALCSKLQKAENMNASEIPVFETDFYCQKRKTSMKHIMAKTTQSLVYISDEIYDPWSWPCIFAMLKKQTQGNGKQL